MEFGTGAVKITPAHDFNDYEVGISHKLPFVKCINELGLITDVSTKLQSVKLVNGYAKIFVFLIHDY